MTGVAPAAVRAARRIGTTRHYVMALPTYLDVVYSINPWMNPAGPFDPERAGAQWDDLRDLLAGLGHRVDVIPAVPGLPDLVFAANGALVIDDVALLSQFRHPERAAETPIHEQHLRDRTVTVAAPGAPFEGEGDVVVAGDLLLVGHGFRTAAAAVPRVHEVFGREVLALELVDPRFYHLDTAVGVAAPDVLVWHPPALAPVSADRLRRRFPTAIEVDEHDARLLGCNLVGDGRHVVVPRGVGRLAHDLRGHGLEVVEVAVDELALAGGGPKCCTAEWHRSATPS